MVVNTNYFQVLLDNLKQWCICNEKFKEESYQKKKLLRQRNGAAMLDLCLFSLNSHCCQLVWQVWSQLFGYTYKVWTIKGLKDTDKPIKEKSIRIYQNLNEKHYL